MKTLDQVEARTPIDATHTPGDANNEFIIAQAGSYYLTGNLNTAKSTCIRITVAGVTVDLNGFQIAFVGVGSSNGISVDAAGHNCTIRNGSITGFTGGGFAAVRASSSARGGTISHVIASNGQVGLSVGEGWRIESCIVHDNASEGIATGAGATITSCSVSNNGARGFLVGSGSTILDCSASGNGFNGFQTGSGCTLTNCLARANTSTNITSSGILTGDGCTITACAATNNTSTYGTLTGETGAGIVTGASSKVQNCSASANQGDGIRASNDCSIVGNVSAANGNSGDGAGVHVTSDDNRIEGNNVTSNDRGIDVDVAGNLIIKNSASGNTGTGMPSANYDIVASNFVGTIVTTEAAMNSATNSNINISY